MRIHSHSAVVFRSAQPVRLARFYDERLGVAFVGRSHGQTDLHQEARVGGMRFAIVPCEEPQQGISPTFLVNGLDGCLHSLEQAGVTLQEPIQSLGEGKRLASLQDIDKNTFQLIDLEFLV